MIGLLTNICSINNNLPWISIDLSTAIPSGVTYNSASWLKYNPLTKILIGNLLITSSVANQGVILTLPSGVPTPIATKVVGNGLYESPTTQALAVLNTAKNIVASYSAVTSLTNVNYQINAVLG